MSKGGGGGGHQETTTSTEPWEGIQGYLRDLYARADQLSGQPINPFQLSPQDRLAQFQQMTGTVGPNANFDRFFRNRGFGDVRTGLQLGVMPFTPTELQAQGMATDLAGRGPNPLLQQGGQAALGLIGQNPMDTPGAGVIQSLSQQPLNRTAGFQPTQDTVSGQYLKPDSNPFLRQMAEAAGRPVIEQFQADVLPSIRTQFSMAGHTPGGSSEGFEVGRATDRLAQTLADQSANLYGQAYGQERGLQEQAIDRLTQMGQNQGRLNLGAAGLLADISNNQDRTALGALAQLPGFAGQQYQMDVNNIGLLGNVGAAQRELGQQLIGQQDPLLMAPWQQLQLQNQILQGGFNFNNTSQQTPFFQNRLAGALGGGLSGAGLGAMLGGPVGAGIGGLGGLLLGGLF